MRTVHYVKKPCRVWVGAAMRTIMHVLAVFKCFRQGCGGSAPFIGTDSRLCVEIHAVLDAKRTRFIEFGDGNAILELAFT